MSSSRAPGVRVCVCACVLCRPHHGYERALHAPVVQSNHVSQRLLFIEHFSFLHERDNRAVFGLRDSQTLGQKAVEPGFPSQLKDM